MFLNIMTKIQGYPEDEMLRTVGARGFPTLLIMNSSGEVVTKRVPRDVAGMAAAMKAAPRPEPPTAKRVDAASVAMEFVRRVKMDQVEYGDADRAIYLSCRGSLNEKQRTSINDSFARLQLKAATAAAGAAEADSSARLRAKLAISSARAKLGMWPETKGTPLEWKISLGAGVKLLEASNPGTRAYDDHLRVILKARAQLGRIWVSESAAPTALAALMHRAESERDPHLFSVWLREWKAATKGKAVEEGIRHSARLDRLWRGIPPLRLSVPR